MQLSEEGEENCAFTVSLSKGLKDVILCFEKLFCEFVFLILFFFPLLEMKIKKTKQILSSLLTLIGKRNNFEVESLKKKKKIWKSLKKKN